MDPSGWGRQKYLLGGRNLTCAGPGDERQGSLDVVLGDALHVLVRGQGVDVLDQRGGGRERRVDRGRLCRALCPLAG